MALREAAELAGDVTLLTAALALLRDAQYSWSLSRVGAYGTLAVEDKTPRLGLSELSSYGIISKLGR